MGSPVENGPHPTAKASRHKNSWFTRQSDTVKAAVIAGVFAVAVAVITGAFGIVSLLSNESNESSAEPEVTFYAPGPQYPPITAKSPLDLSGTVSGLPPGHSLYIVSRTSGGAFFILKGTRSSSTQSFAAADRDGPWGAHDGGVGSATDSSGTVFTFAPYDADTICAEALNAAGKASAQHRIDAMPKGCTPLKPEATVTLK